MARQTRRAARARRHRRVRERVRGTAQRPRLAIFRSLTNIYAQLVDDTAGRTVAAASTLDVDVRPATASPSSGETPSKATKSDHAKAAGALLAERARAAGVAEVVFDRGGYRYHGRVKALADAARAGGLKF